MALFKIKLTERKRNAIAIITALMSSIAVLLLIGLFGISCYTFVFLKSKAHLIGSDLSVGFLGGVYIFIGLVLILEHLILCYAIYYARFLSIC